MPRSRLKSPPVRIPRRLVAEYEAGDLTIPQLARRLHADGARVTAELHRLGVDTSRSHRHLLLYQRRGIDHTRAVDLYKSGLTLEEVGKLVELTREGVRYVLLRAKVPTGRRQGRPIIFHGERMDPKDFACHLRQLRTDAGLSLRELARRTGISAATIWAIETRRVRPWPATVAKLAAQIG